MSASSGELAGLPHPHRMWLHRRQAMCHQTSRYVAQGAVFYNFRRASEHGYVRPEDDSHKLGNPHLI